MKNPYSYLGPLFVTLTLPSVLLLSTPAAPNGVRNRGA